MPMSRDRSDVRRNTRCVWVIPCLLGCAIVAPGIAWAGEPALGGMIEVLFQGTKTEGSVVRWNHDEVNLLGRDGRLWRIDPNQVTAFQETSLEFQPYSPSEVRAALLRELGNDYEVNGTGHYWVAHPRGQRDKWADRFEQLYRSFVHYFSVRGFAPSQPKLPLMGIVCRNREEFARQASAGHASLNGVTGYYDVVSNRITIYDMGGDDNSEQWRRNAAVLIHEATHQTAFNTGIHSRYSLPPLWLAEGLAMLFESPGVYDSRTFTQRADRVNRDRLHVFRQSLAGQHKPEWLRSLIASDDLFRLQPAAAYAEAWAFSFFLIETEPHRYFQYLRRTAARPPFQPYTAKKREADFLAVFGDDWRMLESQFLRFMTALD